MIKKIISATHVVLSIAAMWFIGAAFSQALASWPNFGIVENCVIAANAAILASLCRDLSK